MDAQIGNTEFGSLSRLALWVRAKAFGDLDACRKLGMKIGNRKEVVPIHNNGLVNGEALAEYLRNSRSEEDRRAAYADVQSKLQESRKEIVNSPEKQALADETRLETHISVPLLLDGSLGSSSTDQNNIDHQNLEEMATGKKGTSPIMIIIAVMIFLSAAYGFYANKAGWWPFGSSKHAESTATHQNQKKENKKSTTATVEKTPQKTTVVAQEKKPVAKTTVQTTASTESPTVLGRSEGFVFYGLLAAVFLGVSLAVWKKRSTLGSIGSFMAGLSMILFIILSVSIFRSKRQVREKQTVVDVSPATRQSIVDSVRNSIANQQQPVPQPVPQQIPTLIVDTVAQQQRDMAIQQLADAKNEIAQERLTHINVVDSLNKIILAPRPLTHADSAGVYLAYGATLQKKDKKPDDAVVQQKSKPQQKPQTKKTVTSTVRVDKTQTGGRNSTRRDDNAVFVPHRVNGYQSGQNKQVDRTQDQ